MAEIPALSALVGQPFRLGAEEIAVFESCNPWRVYYLRFPDGARRCTSVPEWREKAKPISLDRDWNAIRPGAIGASKVLFLGARLRHARFGLGYVIAWGSKEFEVSFEREGPKRFEFPKDWQDFQPVAGIGERLLLANKKTAAVPMAETSDSAIERRSVDNRIAPIATPAIASCPPAQDPGSAQPPQSVKVRNLLGVPLSVLSRLPFPTSMNGPKNPDTGTYRSVKGPRKSKSLFDKTEIRITQSSSIAKTPRPKASGNCTCNGNGPKCKYCRRRERKARRKLLKKPEANRDVSSPASSPVPPTPDADLNIYESKSSGLSGQSRPVLKFAPRSNQIQCPHCRTVMTEKQYKGHKRNCKGRAK